MSAVAGLYPVSAPGGVFLPLFKPGDQEMWRIVDILKRNGRNVMFAGSLQLNCVILNGMVAGFAIGFVSNEAGERYLREVCDRALLFPPTTGAVPSNVELELIGEFPIH